MLAKGLGSAFRIARQRELHQPTVFAGDIPRSAIKADRQAPVAVRPRKQLLTDFQQGRRAAGRDQRRMEGRVPRLPILAHGRGKIVPHLRDARHQVVRGNQPCFPVRIALQHRQPQRLAFTELPRRRDIAQFRQRERRDAVAAMVVEQRESFRRQPRQGLTNRGHAHVAERLEIGKAQPVTRLERPHADRLADRLIGIARQRAAARALLLHVASFYKTGWIFENH